MMVKLIDFPEVFKEANVLLQKAPMVCLQPQVVYRCGI